MGNADLIYTWTVDHQLSFIRPHIKKFRLFYDRHVLKVGLHH